ncbi:CMP-N-acetylneuraminic acid synthetase [Roseivirga sp. 4D4]|uniref:acylneuraminate cytidylyltransferase family protein n=1 Tax=Roseivirga sp. 4D4 TaxID=1889784 RepID=UPI000853EDAA|nr:acylneuraminate cytidylyltransferase family protein [Roseivirga sp. 4D4]OEK01630.1 CMP-N-acetylneuraminic acid synthetase [Roseivirga sp. 4D4]
MKTLFLIPARGGSKGIPGKNIKQLNGKPLICHTIDVARGLTEDINICVSTDSEEIKKVVESYGLNVPFIRPAELATDKAGTEEVIEHAIDHFLQSGLRYETVVLLQPTSPLRTEGHVKEALDVYKQKKEMVVSVNLSKANPYYSLYEENEGAFLVKSKKGEFNRRQDCPLVYEFNGAIYIFSIDAFKEHGLFGVNMIKYLMEEKYSIDLDTEIDWVLAEYYMNLVASEQA